MGPFARVTLGVVVLVITLAMVLPYVRAFVHVAFLPLLVLLLFIYVGRLLWWYTGL